MSEDKDEYPTLTQMGITRASEISSYVVSRERAATDVLKIRYQREKGSFLPQSRKYNFARTARSIIADSGKDKTELYYEISPMLIQATAELDTLVIEKRDASSDKAQLLLEVAELEMILNERIGAIRTRIERI